MFSREGIVFCVGSYFPDSLLLSVEDCIGVGPFLSFGSYVKNPCLVLRAVS